MGWNIFPMWAAGVVLLAATGSTVALLKKERNIWAVVLMLLAILGMAGFIAILWTTLERPPLRTMGETRLWYSFFLFVAGLFTYWRWQYRWIMPFSTVLATVFIVINILKPEIHDHSLMPALQSVWFVPHVSVYMSTSFNNPFLSRCPKCSGSSFSSSFNGLPPKATCDHAAI